MSGCTLNGHWIEASYQIIRLDINLKDEDQTN